MGKGYIQVQLTVAFDAKPITNAHVTITTSQSRNKQLDDVLLIDTNGKSEIVSLDAPERELSLSIENKEQPYGTYDIYIVAIGYQRVLIKGVQIFDSETAFQLVEMLPLLENQDIDKSLNVINITPHKLLLNPKEFKKIGPKYDPYLSQKVIIPEFIIVHLGKPDDNGINYTVSFKDYIKNVTASEIYPTWPVEAIEANILAIISFALNRLYSNWYTGKGYDYNITSSMTYDQYFVKGRNTFRNINLIVDDIFNKYIRKIGGKAPLLATTCSQLKCNGLSQWGSLKLAQNSYTTFSILQSYYGTDVELVRSKDLEGIFKVYPEIPIKFGDVGENVKLIQYQLNKISINYPKIPKIEVVDGKFNEDTEDSVKIYQNIFGLNQDGYVDRATWYSIAYTYTAVIRLENLLADDNIYKDGTFPGAPLQLGNTGEDVKELQYYLSVIREYYPAIPAITINGVYDSNTKRAVSAFQKYFKLNPDGIVGVKTWNMIYNVYESIKESFDFHLNYDNKPDKVYDYPGINLKFGDCNRFVRLMQKYINILNNDNSPENINTDGVFGLKTENYIIELQRNNGQIDNGIVDKSTWDCITKLYSDICIDVKLPKSLCEILNEDKKATKKKKKHNKKKNHKKKDKDGCNNC